jgi:RNA polymerase sigma-70 factor (ECF subfamily)
MSWAANDLELMKRIARRDQEALRALYDQYARIIYSLAYHILQNSVMAEEVSQDVFLKVWEQRALWDPGKGQLSSWLLRVTQFTAVDRLRREQRQPSLESESLDDIAEASSGGLSDTPSEDHSILRMIMSELPRDQLHLIDLAFFRGMSHSEIAEHTHIPLGTVKTRLRSGLKLLRELWLESSAAAPK